MVFVNSFTHCTRIEEDRLSNNNNRVKRRSNRWNKLDVAVAIDSTKDTFADARKEVTEEEEFSFLFPWYRLSPCFFRASICSTQRTFSWKPFLHCPLSRILSFSLSQQHLPWHLWKRNPIFFLSVYYSTILFNR